MPRINRPCVLLVLAMLRVCLDAEGAETVSFAPHTFTIPDGYELQRVASPPLVQRPIHMCFDDAWSSLRYRQLG